MAMSKNYKPGDDVEVNLPGTSVYLPFKVVEYERHLGRVLVVSPTGSKQFVEAKRLRPLVK